MRLFRVLDLSPAEVHADLSTLGVSPEVHALVDDLELVPIVVDERLKRFIIARAVNQTSRDLVTEYVRPPYHAEKEETGRLF